MKKIKSYNSNFCIIIIILLTVFSCKQKNDIPSINDYSNTKPDNVHLSSYSSSNITVAWERIEDAASYTVELLTSKDSETPVDEYTTISRDKYSFTEIEELVGYYVRVRANFNTVENPVLGDWVYVLDGQSPGRIMPKYGFVDEDFEEPEPEPEPEPEFEEYLYDNFPEGFEDILGDRKGTYASEDPEFYASGEWELYRVQTMSAGSLLHKVDKFAALYSPNIDAFVAMNFDLEKGADKLTFVTGIATAGASDANNLPITMSVFYSTDGGDNWNKIDDILIDEVDKQYVQEYEDLGIADPVRFKFQKNDSGARPIVDQIAVYYLE